MTNARERFAREVAAGKSQADAYREAFPRSRNWKPETLHKRASELAATGEVSGRVEELRREADAAAIMDCRELRTRLTKRLRALDEEGGRDADFCRLAETFARVSGWMTPAALAVAVSGSGVALTPEDKSRRLCEILGVPFDTAKTIGYDEAWRRFREALGIRDMTPEERAQKVREALGLPPEEPEPTREELERRHREFLAREAEDAARRD